MAGASDARPERAPKSFDMVTSTAALKGTSTASPNQVQNGKGFDLKAEDFIKMMITQLQNQDPMEPAKNEELLAQMSQIGQLESSTQLQDSLKSLVLQNNIGAAGKWFDTTAFAQPTGVRFGNTGRNQFYGPGGSSLMPRRLPPAQVHPCAGDRLESRCG